MLRAAREIQRLGAKTLTTYTLVLKRSSVFVPTCWGLMIDDHDRCYSLLDKLPNNRLHPSHLHGHLGRLCEEDLTATALSCGVEAIDRVTWADRWYDMRCSERERRTYLLEIGRAVVGYITFAMSRLATGENVLVVDEVAVDTAHHGQGHAGTLMRWAETSARHNRCNEIRLWAIDDKVPMYTHLGYELVRGEERMRLEDQNYTLMTKKVIYHL